MLKAAHRMENLAREGSYSMPNPLLLNDAVVSTTGHGGDLAGRCNCSNEIKHVNSRRFVALRFFFS